MKLWMLIVLAVFLLTVLVLAIVVTWQFVVLKRKNRVLMNEIAAHVTANDSYMRLKGRTDLPIAQKDAESIPLLKNKNDKELFEFLSVVIVSEGLFLNPAFNRQILMDRFHLTKDRVGAAFSRGSSYGSLPMFINECRLNESVKMLSEHPEIPITEVARLCGYTNASTFTLKFKERYTVTPSEFKQSNIFS